MYPGPPESAKRLPAPVGYGRQIRKIVLLIMREMGNSSELDISELIKPKNYIRLHEARTIPPSQMSHESPD